MHALRPGPPPRADRLPEALGAVGSLRGEADHVGVLRGAPPTWIPALEPHPEVERAVVVEEHVVDGHLAPRREAQRCSAVDVDELLARQGRDAPLEAKLSEPVAAPQSYGERERRDLDPQAPREAARRLVEARVPVDQDPGEDVAASGRAARVEAAVDACGELELLLQGDEVDQPALEDRAVVAVERQAGGGERVQALLDRRVAGEEAGAHAVGLAAEPEVEAGGLDLGGGGGRASWRGADRFAEERSKLVVDEDVAGGGGHGRSPR